MSISFPVKYETQNNSSVMKYYLSNKQSNIKLETDVCLKNMIQHNNDETILILDRNRYPNNNGNVVFENTNFSQNLKIDDINCSISNPTSFCISSNFMQQPVDLINQYFTNNIGTNTFNDVENTLSTILQLSTDNSPIFDTDLVITTTNPNNLFNSRNNTWKALFEENNNVLLEKAVNSGLNNQTNLSLLTISEDINFNNNYALGKEKLSYYTENSVTNKIEINSIDTANLVTYNNIDINVNPILINTQSFGRYKIVFPESSVSVLKSNNTIGKNYSIETELLENIQTYTQYVDLFDDTSENNNFKIQLTNVNNNSGLNFTDVVNNSIFEINNAPMINNDSFMKNIVFTKKSISMDITQNDMTITPNISPFNLTSAYITNNNYLTLSSNGEKLDYNDYNTDGEINLEIFAKTNRSVITNGTDVQNNVSPVYPEITVDYNTIPDELKTNKYVNYQIENIVSPTGSGEYNSDVYDSNNGVSLFTKAIYKTNSNISLTSDISTTDNEIALIKIMPLLKIISQSSNADNLYILNNDDSLADEAISENIMIKINGDITELKEKDDLRFTVFPKKLSDLKISYSGDSDGYNKITTYESVLSDINISDSNKKDWCIGYYDDANSIKTYLTSDSFAFLDSAQIFPSVDDYIYICDNNNISFQLNIEYVINGFNADQINISYVTYPQSFLRNPSSITGKTNLIQKNNSKESEKYKKTNNVLFKSNYYYDQVEVTTVSKYNLSFRLNLAGFNNIAIMTPLINSTEIKYYYYVRQVISGTQHPNNIDITNDGKSISVRNHTNAIVEATTSFNTGIISNQIYKTTTTIKLDSDPSKLIKTLLTIDKNSITPLNGQMQYRNKINSNTYGIWTNINSIIENIEPYYATEAIKIINDYELNINIYPNTNNKITFDKPTYFVPLNLDNTSTTSVTTGYKYDINNITSIITKFYPKFDPESYLINDLIEGDQTLNLFAEIRYINPDPTEGNQTYKAVMEIKDNTGSIIATINTDKPDFSAPIVLAKCNKNLFKVISTFNINDFINNDKGSNVVGGIPRYIQGINDINDKSSGSIDLSDGISVKYQNIKQSDFVDFSLKPDNINVKLVGSIGSEPTNPIASLTYSNLNTEEISIPYYRGYATDDQMVTKIYKYTINRKDLSSYILLIDDVISSSEFKNIYKDSQNTIIFTDIGSIGTTIKSLFSRLPKTKLNNTSLKMPIKISSDSVTITRRSTKTGTTSITSITKLLQDYELYTFVNGKKLRSLNLRASGAALNNSQLDDSYSINFGKANISVYYNNSYIGNPASLSDAEWGTKISEVSFLVANDGFIINEAGSNTNGFLTVTLHDNSKTNSISYFVVSRPQIYANQLTKDGAKVLPFNTTDPSVYDATKIVTKYLPIMSNTTTTYNPFASNANVNNITFTSINKEFADYNDPTKNNIDVDFIISGSTIKIQEVDTQGNPTQIGPDNDGIIFIGTINDLISMPNDNIYYNYIQLDSKVNNLLNLSYTQQNKRFFETVFIDSNVKPINNIKFSINGYFMKNNNPSYKLVSSTTKGIKTNIYDMIKRESDIVLLKYECLNIDFTNIPVNTPVHKITFVPSKVYSSIVTVPNAQFGDKYLAKYNSINILNMDVDVNNNINWSEINAPDLLANFSLTINAINTDGLNDIVELLYATSEIPVNFTVINQTNAMEILACDGTPRFRISPFGEIITPNINVNSLTFFNKIENGNIDLFKANANNIQ